MTARRIQYEINELNNDKTILCTATQLGESKQEWILTMNGPPDTPYSTGIFILNMDFSADHPFSPPKVSFQTKIYHPNIDMHGNICIDILKDNWSPVLTVSKIVSSLQSLLTDPNPHDPLMQESADLYLDDRVEFNAKAKLWCNLYASASPQI